MSTQITHLLFSEQALNDAVADYRERVRQDDSEEMKSTIRGLICKKHFGFDNPETRDRGLALLSQMIVQDTQGLFEPSAVEPVEASPVVETETEPNVDDLPGIDGQVLSQFTDDEMLLSPKEIVETTGLSDGQVQRALAKLVKAECIHKVGRGTYQRTLREHLAEMSTENVV